MGDVWTADRCWHAFYNDYAIATAAAPHVFWASVFADMNEPRKVIPAAAPIAIPVTGAVLMTYFGGKTYENATKTKTAAVTDMASNKPSDVSTSGEVKA
jgi:hypothetical protein